MGVYLIIVSRPANWHFTVRGLCTLCSDGISCVKAAIKELEEAGYLKRDGVVFGEGRFHQGEWIVYDRPVKDSGAVENPVSENPVSEIPVSENRTQINNNRIITDIINTEQYNKGGVKFKKRATPAAVSGRKPSYDIEAFKRDAMADNLVYVKRSDRE